MSSRKRSNSFDHPPRQRPSMALPPKNNDMRNLTSQFEGLGKRTDLHDIQRKKLRYKKELEKLSSRKYECLSRVRILQKQLFSCTTQNNKRLARIIADRNQTQRKLALLRLQQPQLEKQVRNLKRSNEWYQPFLVGF